MKAKNILRISVFTALLCIMTIFSVFATETDNYKIIRWDNKGNLTVNITDGSGYNNYDIGTDNGVLRIDMPAEKAYNDCSAWAYLNLGEQAFDLKDYPYVKLKMRTNYSETIQYYAGRGNSHHRADFKGLSNIADSNWHVIEFSFDDNNSNDDCYISLGKYEDNAKVSTPFFQFKEYTESPDGDLFAEIEYIGYFESEEDMKAYDDSVILYTGAELYPAVDNKELTSEQHGDVLRLNADSQEATTEFNIKNVIKDSDGLGLDLYEYPYIRMRFRTNYQYQIQMYPLQGDANYWYSDLHDYLTAAARDGETWYDAMLSYNSADKVDRTNAWNIEYIEIESDGHTWSTTQKWDYGSDDRYYPFPSAKDEFALDGFKFQLKSTAQNGAFFDIAYIAFYKDKDTMLKDATYATEYTSGIEKVNTALENIKKTSFSYNLHQAVGEIAIEDYVRKAIESANNDISVAANATNFDRTADKCSVAVTVSCGGVYKTATVDVTLNKLDAITLETLGAQIRNKENDEDMDALRFGTKFAYNSEQYEIVSYGTLMIPKEFRNNSSFETVSVSTSTNTGKNGKFEGADCVVNIADKKFYEFTGYQIFTGVLTKIDEAHKSTEISARPYVTYKLKSDFNNSLEDKTYTIYGNEIVRSVNQVAAAKADSEVTENGKWDNENN